MEQNRRDRYSSDSRNDYRNDFRDEKHGRFDRRNESNRDRDQFNQGNFNDRQGNDWNQQNDYSNNFRNQQSWQEDFGNDRNRENQYRSGQGDGGFNQWNQDSFRSGRSNQFNQNDYSNQGNSRNFGNDRGFGTDYSQQYRGASDFNQERFRNQNQEHNRDWWNRTRDEVSSWFGDDDAERRRHQDRMQSGPHRGKGPKEYSRSDERIREDVCDRLSDDEHIDASDIDVRVSGNEVILSGTVDSRDTKRRAEDVAERVSGVTNVQNQLRVGQAAQQTETKTKAGQTSSAIKPEKIHHN